MFTITKEDFNQIMKACKPILTKRVGECILSYIMVTPSNVESMIMIDVCNKFSAIRLKIPTIDGVPYGEKFCLPLQPLVKTSKVVAIDNQDDKIIINGDVTTIVSKPKEVWADTSRFYNGTTEYSVYLSPELLRNLMTTFTGSIRIDFKPGYNPMVISSADGNQKAVLCPRKPWKGGTPAC